MPTCPLWITPSDRALNSLSVHTLLFAFVQATTAKKWQHSERHGPLKKQQAPAIAEVEDGLALRVVLGAVSKGEHSRRQLVHSHRPGIHVRRKGGGLFQEHLWCHVLQRPHLGNRIKKLSELDIHQLALYGVSG